MTVTADELNRTVIYLRTLHAATRWYRPLLKYRLLIMADTIAGVLAYMQGTQRSCGCVDHTNHYTN